GIPGHSLTHHASTARGPPSSPPVSRHGPKDAPKYGRPGHTCRQAKPKYPIQPAPSQLRRRHMTGATRRVNGPHPPGLAILWTPPTPELTVRVVSASGAAWLPPGTG
ncbi:MAG TPA: hypothetical protein VN648_14735, partial [Candidatus Methylomirabilis sp.]|nr:hypothetical protein [Candidatus Methylomirabilis sp.]